ncbi:MAG: S-layer homology domain-containing protein, partial [Clostridia bacterium]
MFKKLLSAAVALCLICSVMAPLAMAASSFSDVISPDYDWAIDDIEEMTKLGIIKGYTDGTFRPANTIKKIEMLLLLSRAVGYPSDEKSDYSDFADYAETLYKPVLDEYDLGTTYNKYKPEVAFLLYKGILSIDELDTYLNNASSTVKRYEAAILLTKLMGAEEEVKKNTAVVLDYSDYTEIPVNARAYVEYVTAQGLMKGIEDNNFGPDENVTRVQVTIMLRRIIDKLDLSTKAGTIKSVDAGSNTVSIYNEDSKTTEEYTVNPRSVKILKDGFSAGLADIDEGSKAILLYSGTSITALEVISPASDETVTGRLSDITVKTNYTRFSVIDSKTGSTRSFMILSGSEPEITYDGKECKFSKLSSGDTVTVTVKNGAVVS